MQTSGRFFDGETGLRLEVEVSIDEAAQRLRLAHPDLPSDLQDWPVTELRALGDEARTDQITISLRADHSADSALIDNARLILSEGVFIARLRKMSPSLHKRDLPKRTYSKVAARIGMAVGAVVLMLFVILPAMAHTLAEIIPPERESRWGKSVVAQMERFFGGREIGALTCVNPKGEAALQTMMQRLTSGTELEYDVNIRIFDHKMVNAFAAPGGEVVLMRGLIKAAKSPDEVAAVLAHEIAHVENRDATRNTLRAAGSAGLLSMVLGDFAGGSLAVIIADATLNASYTREAEAAADAYALAMLNSSGTSSAGMADFFAYVAKLQGGIKIPEYLSSHPSTDGREARAREFAETQSETKPILNETEWQALREICD
ncbi:MAG: M48 family metallopeptidase [Pseudomonadota bacterium]